MTETTFEHLDPSVWELATKPNAVRIADIKADKWISYTAANQALQALNELFESPKKIRMPNLLLVGPTNNGKSMIIEKFRRKHMSAAPKDAKVDMYPVLVVEMPSTANQKRFYSMVLDALNAPYRPTDLLPKLESQALKLLVTTGVRVLVIDEIHNVLTGSNIQVDAMFNLLRFLGNKMKISLVAVGVKKAFLAIHSDEQLANRFEPFMLPRWQDDEEMDDLLASFEMLLPLRQPSNLTAPNKKAKILAMSEGILGEVATILARSATLAITSGKECIDMATLDQIRFIPPSLRQTAAADDPRLV